MCPMQWFAYKKARNNVTSELRKAKTAYFSKMFAKDDRVVPLLAEVDISSPTIRNKIEALNTNKSIGPNNIQPKLLRLAGDAFIPSLGSLYRYSIESKTVFTSWEMAKITPVFKKDDETDRGNYKPISLLSVPSKILGSLVNDALVVCHSLKENAELVSDKQWAYHTGHSTELLLLHLTETWRSAVDSG